MRIALAYPDVGETTSLGRETLLIAKTLGDAGIEVHTYQRPGPDRDGMIQHPVGGAAPVTSRVGGAIALGRWAGAASRAISRDRARYDVVCAVGTAEWEHDLVRVHAVIRAEQRRWPTRGGRRFRAARSRAALAPLLRPQIAVERAIQRRQFQPTRFRRALAVTQEVADDLTDQFGTDPSLIDVIPCLIDYDRFAAVTKGREELAISPRRELLFVGNDFGRKGLAVAIDALNELAPDVQLVVVGGDDPEPFRRQAAKLGLLERVDFKGATTSPETFFADAAALVLPTTEDVWGMVLVEAMAAGVPVIASSSAGANEFVKDSRAGIVTDDLDPRTLARAVEQVLVDPSRAAAMGAAGRRAAAAFNRASIDGLVRAFEPPNATAGADG